MKHLKNFGLAAVTAMILMAFLGANTASATTLEVEGWAQNKSVLISASLSAGHSTTFKHKELGTLDTCTTSHLNLSTFAYTPAVEGTINSFTLWGCSHTTHVLKNGQFKINWTSGTNGTVYLSGMEVTMASTALGASLICKPILGASGTLTGVSSGNATIDIKATLRCNLWPGDVIWEGTYSVTSPWGLGVVS